MLPVLNRYFLDTWILEGGLWPLFPLLVLIAARRQPLLAWLACAVFAVALVTHSVLPWKAWRYFAYAMPFFFIARQGKDQSVWPRWQRNFRHGKASGAEQGKEIHIVTTAGRIHGGVMNITLSGKGVSLWVGTVALIVL